MTDSTDPRSAERRQRVFPVLGAFFAGCALLAERIGKELVPVFTPWHVVTLSCGVTFADAEATERP